ncbi:MAG: threonine ammonia-lyase [Nannocystaceae bacterium]
MSGSQQPLSLADIRAAHARIAPYVLRTPVLARTLANGTELLCKPESLQPIGAFKLRGAFNCLLTLPPGTRGVVTHSSGNHAQAVARAGRLLNIPAVVVMPDDAPAIKRARTEADGAQIIVVGPDSAQRRERARVEATKRGYVLVESYDDPVIAAGQGTAGLELCEDAGPLDRFYAPISGGGLMSGCAVAVHGLFPDAEIIGVEPMDGGDTRESLLLGKRTRVPPPQTIADGLRVRTPGIHTFPIIQQHVSRIELVDDDEMIEAMAWALTHLRIVLEPSGAASLALALRERNGGRCGVLLSGGNVDHAILNQAVQASKRGTPS